MERSSFQIIWKKKIWFFVHCISLKHLSNFWRSLNIPLINCKVELILTWSKNCVLVHMTEKDAEGDNPTIVAPTRLEFKIRDTKLYIPVVTLSRENDTNF